MKKIWKEFKEFAIKGNALDLAVGVIIGAAFGSIVTSLVKDIVMPPISLLTGGLDFSNKFVVLKAGENGLRNFASPAEALAAKAITWNWGNFLTLILNFLIVGFAVFMLVRGINTLKRPHPKGEPVVKDCPFCRMSIPAKAVRCPHCTSEMTEKSAAV